MATMREKTLMRLYFDAAHPASPKKAEANAALEREFGVRLVGEPTGGLQSVPYDSVPDSLHSLRLLPGLMGDRDALRVLYGLAEGSPDIMAPAPEPEEIPEMPDTIAEPELRVKRKRFRRTE